MLLKYYFIWLVQYNITVWHNFRMREVARLLCFLTLCMLGNFFMLFLLSAYCLKISFFKNFFQEHYQSIERFGSRSGPTFCQCWSGSKLFVKVISRWQKSPLARKELNYQEKYIFRQLSEIFQSGVPGGVTLTQLIFYCQTKHVDKLWMNKKTKTFRRDSYGKYSKLWPLFLFINKMLVIKARIHIMLLRITNKENPDQTASSAAVWSGSVLFV